LFCCEARSIEASTFWLICIPHFSDAARLDVVQRSRSIALFVPSACRASMVPHIEPREAECLLR
jgi:hypothetical protein